jgi:cyclopropane fatty-acyl-phospholipid synthase-like methyltransferase
MNKFFTTKLIVACLVNCLVPSIANSAEISEKGYWIGDVPDWHYTDRKLAGALVNFWQSENVRTLVDFGCGEGEYVRTFIENGIDCEGYDGNPSTPEITRGLCKVLDLSAPFDLNKTFDWVLSIEVGEHLPHQFERIYIENLMRHAKKGIVTSWAVKNQGGTGHFNEQDNDYIKSIFVEAGYINDLAAEEFLRANCSACWFQNTIMVFRKE